MGAHPDCRAKWRGQLDAAGPLRVRRAALCRDALRCP